MNISLKKDLLDLDMLTRSETWEDREIKKIDFKEILEKAKRELRITKNYADRCLNRGLENSVKLSVS